MRIHHLTVEESLRSLRTTPEGLTGPEAARRLREFGENRIERVKRKPAYVLLLRQYVHFFAVILWFGAGLAFVAEALAPGEGMKTLGYAILGVIVLNGLFSFWQEYRAERALEALEKLLPHQVKTLRDGEVVLLPAEKLVPGDIVVLQEGDEIPADCRLVAAEGVRANLSTVTGEPLPKARDTGPSDEEDILHADNVLLAGTMVVSGEGKALVFATGPRTEFSKIAHLTQTARPSPSPLQKELANTTRKIGIVAILVGLLFFGIGRYIGLSFWANFTFAIGIIVAFVPEGLLPTLTLSLAMAAQRMARRNALIRHLPAVEALGSATVICTDKTGTLTLNRMAVKSLFLGGGLIDPGELPRDTEAGRRFLDVALLCHDLKRTEKGGWLGDPMEAALVGLAGPDAMMPEAERVGGIPFDTDRKRLTVLVRTPEGLGVYTKGAPETVVPLCTTVLVGDEVLPLDEEWKKRFEEAQASLADKGLRVLAFARREAAEDETGKERQGEWEEGMTLLGLVGIADPPRPEVPEAVRKCREAGIRVVMITGDHPHTALAIAREVGLVHNDSPLVLTGPELWRLSDTQLQFVLDAPEILFARVTADQKLRIVTALKRKGEIVAVTGDGVNDAPAMKSADIGVAMGLSGTEVAREAADMVLLDDNFASIVAAVEEGRAVFENIRKTMCYILTSNVPEAVPFLSFVLLPIPLPLTVFQILAVDLGTDILPALALGAEKAGSGVMRRPPRPRGERLLNLPLLSRAYLFLGPLEALAAMAAFFHVLKTGGWSLGEHLAQADPLYLSATTATLAAIIVTQVANLLACRSNRESAFSRDYPPNRLLWWGVASELTIILLVIYTPIGQRIYGTAPIGIGTWLYMIPFALGMLALEEARKFVVRRL